MTGVSPLSWHTPGGVARAVASISMAHVGRSESLCVFELAALTGVLQVKGVLLGGNFGGNTLKL